MMGNSACYASTRLGEPLTCRAEQRVVTDHLRRPFSLQKEANTR